MHVGDRKRPPLSPQEGWLSDGRQVLHFRPMRYDRWSQSLEVTFGEEMTGGEPPLLKKRRELTREQAIRLWACACSALYCRGQLGPAATWMCWWSSLAAPPLSKSWI
jgi:hypothetical protein